MSHLEFFKQLSLTFKSEFKRPRAAGLLLEVIIAILGGVFGGSFNNIKHENHIYTDTMASLSLLLLFSSMLLLLLLKGGRG